MIKYTLIVLILICAIPEVYSQHYRIEGKIVNDRNKSPIEFATISLPNNELWAITNEKGEFTLNNVTKGKTSLRIYCLGYAKTTIEIDVQANILDLKLSLAESNLALNEVVITAQQEKSSLTTSYMIDRTTLDHSQILNITDITGLLPGGKTRGDINLAANDNRFALRSSGTSELGNASFGTAVEVDGVRLQNNSGFNELATSGSMKGIDTRNVGSSNIESIEVITGIPSVEYGDLSNGVVKINTRKGKSPYIVEMATKPHTKQIALNKGFALGAGAGILNASVEHTKSIKDLPSPYTDYDRNILSLTYSTVFNKNRNNPLTLTVGFTGNIGGYDTEADPDSFKDTYEKFRDNTIRGNFKLNWLLRKSWITNLELSGYVNYSDKLSKVSENKSSSVGGQGAVHSLEEGYYMATDYDVNPNAPVINTPSGYWYELQYTDSKPIAYFAKLKADWVRKFDRITNKVMFGAEFSRSGNKGKGMYYDDMKLAPTWREYKYDEVSYMNNTAIYAEDKMTVPFGESSILQLTAGIRSDITFIKDSDYGTVNSFSPRFNAKYTFWENSEELVRNLSIYAGWGKSVKLPSFDILYPAPMYTDKLAFDVINSYSYYSLPSKAIYNSDLKWQSSRQLEVGLETNIAGARVSVSAFLNKTYNPYISTSLYSPFQYKQTQKAALDNCVIPSEDRVFSIDRNTGIVTVGDKTGVNGSQELEYGLRNDFRINKMYLNGSSVERRGLEWAIDFLQIPSLRTSFRLDGNYYYYKGVEETVLAWKPSSTLGADKNPYQYIGYYAGDITSSSNAANGSLSKQFNTNFTITTHIPKIRLILSMKIEGTFYNYRRNLSEYEGGNRGFVLSDAEGYISSDKDIYGGDRFVAVYPLYYTSWSDPDTQIPFADKFAWAKDNDPALYNELAKLVIKSNSSYYFNPQRISSYYSANISVTKEIGNIASISFYATNFFNNMSSVRNSQNDTESTLYNSSYIPKFYYGLSLRLKM